MADHPDSPLFPVCPFAGRLRKNVGDRFCRDPDVPKQLVRLRDCLACPLAGSVEPAPPRRPKVGDVFAELLAAKFGAKVTSECDCAERIRQMNEWGPDGCEENVETIAGWVIESAAKVSGVHNLAPDWAKRWKLRPLVSQASQTVRDWRPAS